MGTGTGFNQIHLTVAPKLENSTSVFCWFGNEPMGVLFLSSLMTSQIFEYLRQRDRIVLTCDFSCDGEVGRDMLLGELIHGWLSYRNLVKIVVKLTSLPCNVS